MTLTAILYACQALDRDEGRAGRLRSVIRGQQPFAILFGASPRPGLGAQESEEMSMKKKKLEVKIRKLEKIETTINRGGASG
ncbi:hypothetical protein AB0L05_15710 [Nonomuraea pusilla]|uniref:hypothetical protein n=1 Tax=Nonomuraea pusilla TaxID=46177 RepID=UPI00332641F2